MNANKITIKAEGVRHLLKNDPPTSLKEEATVRAAIEAACGLGIWLRASNRDDWKRDFPLSFEKYLHYPVITGGKSQVRATCLMCLAMSD
jgi:hypothetical protein